MMTKIIKAIKNPKKAWRFFLFFLYHNFRKKYGTLVIVGLESEGVFDLMYRGYEKCYCFEANPERFKMLEKKYGKHPNIKLFNVAVAQYNGEITFNISNNDGASSSIGNFNKDWWGKYKKEKIEMVKSITVPCINLNDFCVKNNIDFIDEYVSDIQGMDLEVLKTLNKMLDNKMINRITCEVTKDEIRNIYYNLPDNSESGFEQLLGTNYKLIAKGTGLLLDNRIEDVPNSEYEMDCRWILKNTKDTKNKI